MSVAVVSPAPSAAAPRQTRAATSSAAQAYAALQQDFARQAGQIPHHHPRHDSQTLSNTIPTQVSPTKPNARGGLNILA